jgi:hypothetical protein
MRNPDKPDFGFLVFALLMGAIGLVVLALN